MVSNVENTHTTVKPAAGLLVFSVANGLFTWEPEVSALLFIGLPLLFLSARTLFSVHGVPARWWLLCLLAGALVSSLTAMHYAFTRPDDTLLGKDIEISGYIVSLPVTTEVVTRFDFAVSDESGGHPGKIRLSWYGAPELKVGEAWRLTAKLRQPHGFSSPGAFDYEAWVLRQGIQATGYVKSGAMIDGSVPWQYGIQRLRERLKLWLRAIASDENRGLLCALLLGDKSLITPEQWRMFNGTGTTHLLVISGLHIGLMAWLGFTVAGCLGKMGAIPLRWFPLPVCKAVAGMVVAFCYALLAGFSIPVQRSLVMTFAALLAPLSGLRASSLTLWLLALAAVMAVDPLAVTSQGFWYSFIAVAALLFGLVGRQGEMSWPVKLFKPQWLVFVVLTPLLLVSGQPVSPLSPLVNLFAIPLIGIAVVPLLLLSSALHFLVPDLANIIIVAIENLLTCLQWVLGWVADLMVVIPPVQHLSWLAIILGVGGVLLLVSPLPLRLRWLAPLLMLPMFFPVRTITPEGQAEVTVLDVGQGLSVIIRTHRHLMVYDTGDRFSQRMTAADSVILPALSASGVDRIDRIMISHGDQDHSGGLQPLLSVYPLAEIVSGTSLPGYEGHRVQCQPGDQWQWDGVHFQVFSGGGEPRSNDASCVLKVTAGGESLLLPGDISGRIEKRLLEQGADLRASVLVAAHHGSRFSSSSDFLAAVQPEAVLFSSGFANRFSHPAPETVGRVREAGAKIFNTAVDGSLSLSLGRGDLTVSAYRKTHSRYWWP